MGVTKNKCNNIEIHNYLNMKQNTDLTVCTQQALDSFSGFFLKEFTHTIEKPILQRIDLEMDTLKMDFSEFVF